MGVWSMKAGSAAEEDVAGGVGLVDDGDDVEEVEAPLVQ